MLPKPAPEVITMLKELAQFVVARHPMTEDSKELLESALNDQQNQIKLVLNAVASSKMLRLGKLAAAIDTCQDYATDPTYLKRLKTDPAELRRHLEMLRDIEAADLEMLRSMTEAKAEERGYSKDGSKQYNIFFGEGSSGAVLPNDIDAGSRKNIVTLLDKLFEVAGNDGVLPVPPEANRASRRSRVIDVEVEGDSPE